MRTGVIAKKIGMSRVFNEDGRQVPVTVLLLDDLKVVARRTMEKDGYTAVQLGSGLAKAKNVSKPMRNYFAVSKVEVKRVLKEFRVSSENLIEVGSEITANHYVEGQLVDVSGVSIGKGFAGAMKRHNFGGLRASHGVSISHRSHGSTGQCQDPGRVFKGKKMAGHMGARKVTTQNLEVVSTNEETGVILVRGAVPGAKGGWVTISDAVKKPVNQDAPAPAALKGSVKSIVNTPKKYTRIIVQIINDPTSYFWKIFFLKVFNKVIYFYIRELCKDCTVNLTTNRISLALIQYTTIVGEVFVDQFDKDLRIELNILMNQDCLESFEELSCELGFLFSCD